MHRYFDKIFFTWNKSEEELHNLLHSMNRQLPNMKITLVTNQNMNYLDVNIQQHHGELAFKIVHDLNTEPYSLPYVFGYPCDKYATLLRAILLRATICYVNVDDFVNELQYMELSFQNNRFSNDFIQENIQSFLNEFDASTFKIHCGKEYCHQSLYNQLRENIFKYNRRCEMKQIKRNRNIFHRRRKFSHNKDNLLSIPINLIST